MGYKENKHQPWELAQMQALPLEAKIKMTQSRIKGWYEHFEGQVYTSFSGGKDSTVLKHIIDDMYDDVPAVFADTGLEYPEIRSFVKNIAGGGYECFNSDIVIVKPKMRFDEIIKHYGYPIVSKDIADAVYYTRRARARGNFNTVRDIQLRGEQLDKNGRKSTFNKKKWLFLLDVPFKISARCCAEMKKKPFKRYEKESKRKPFVGTMAMESRQRKSAWMLVGCNAFEGANKRSAPLSFWTEQDVLEYIKKYNVPYASIYGDIIKNEDDEYKTTGATRTGCIFCGFGAHLEKGENRYQKLKETHPKQYNYCINGGEYVDDTWQPNKEGLGMGKVLDEINVKY